MKRLEKRRRELAAKHLGETRLVERILSGFSAREKGRVIVGAGDDAAVIQFGERARVVVTTDMLVEDVHFRLDWSYPEAVGFKAVAANLSDVAAMGGEPVGVVVSLGIPPAVPVRAVDRMYLGISKALSLFGGDLLGGDTVRSNAIIVSVSAVGVLVSEKPLLRSGARVGDKICVTGSVGGSAAGLMLLRRYFGLTQRSRRPALETWTERGTDYFKRKLPPSLRKAGWACVSKHLMPSPRVREARVLSEFGPSAMIDISDGLSTDLTRVARASGVGFVLREENIPIDANAIALARLLGTSPHRMALSSGEEYEILFTIPATRTKEAAAALEKRCRTSVRVIGETVEDKESRLAIGARGRKRALIETGFKHF